MLRPYKVASDPLSSPQALTELYLAHQGTGRVSQVRSLLAKNPNTPPDLLMILVRADETVAEIVASNPSYPLLLVEQQPAALLVSMIVRINRLHARFRTLSIQRRAATAFLVLWNVDYRKEEEKMLLLNWLAYRALYPTLGMTWRPPDLDSTGEWVQRRGKRTLIALLINLAITTVNSKGYREGFATLSFALQNNLIPQMTEWVGVMEEALSFAETYTPREDYGALYWETYGLEPVWLTRDLLSGTTNKCRPRPISLLPR